MGNCCGSEVDDHAYERRPILPKDQQAVREAAASLIAERQASSTAGHRWIDPALVQKKEALDRREENLKSKGGGVVLDLIIAQRDSQPAAKVAHGETYTFADLEERRAIIEQAEKEFYAMHFDMLNDEKEEANRGVAGDRGEGDAGNDDDDDDADDDHVGHDVRDGREQRAPVIGVPYLVRHESHIGMTPDGSFEVKGSSSSSEHASAPDQPLLSRDLFLQIVQAAGVTEAELNDSATNEYILACLSKLLHGQEDTTDDTSPQKQGVPDTWPADQLSGSRKSYIYTSAKSSSSPPPPSRPAPLPPSSPSPLPGPVSGGPAARARPPPPSLVTPATVASLPSTIVLPPRSTSSKNAPARPARPYPYVPNKSGAGASPARPPPPPTPLPPPSSSPQVDESPAEHTKKMMTAFQTEDVSYLLAEAMKLRRGAVGGDEVW